MIDITQKYATHLLFINGFFGERYHKHITKHLYL